MTLSTYKPIFGYRVATDAELTSAYKAMIGRRASDNRRISPSVRAVIQSVLGTGTNRELAKRFCVSQSTVDRIRRAYEQRP